ncbi:hypothetical protein MPNTM1_03320 [Mycolicibacterium parafortuitum]
MRVCGGHAAYFANFTHARRAEAIPTTGQLLAFLTRSRLDIEIREGGLIKVWPGVYSRDQPDVPVRLRGLDLRAREPVAICLGTAAAAYGFDTENTRDIHALNPQGHQLRNSDGLTVHRRDGAPLSVVEGRPATTAAWTAVEVARSLRRPRALATLDAALRSRACDRRGLTEAADRHAGRRGIVAVRDLIPLADGLAESPMESEARLAMLDGGLPTPVLQYVIVDRSRRTWRLDFAWPQYGVAVEYDGFDWHSDREQFTRDRQKRAALAELDWTMISIVADDVRTHPQDMVRRIEHEMARRIRVA